MTVLESAILGVIQGLFMFIPVSSSSHLALAQHWLIQNGSALPPPESAEMVFFNIVVHVGTVVSILIVYRRALTDLVARSVADLRGLVGAGPRTEGLYLKLMMMGLFAVAVTGVLGLTIRKPLESVFANPALIALMLCVTGALLLWTDLLSPRTKGLRDFTWMMALFIGLAQAMAFAPGLSRSGTTIAIALLLGLRRRWAAEFSFFIAIPTIIAGNVLLPILEPEILSAFDPLPLLTGFVVAAVVGTFSLLLVLKLLYKARLRYFSYYVWALAALILADAYGLVDIGLTGAVMGHP